MPDITPTNNIDITAELTNLSLYKYHPTGIVNIAFNRLTDMLSGKVTLVDPSNPFTYLLETNCLNTAFSIQENTLLTRKLYPRLANEEEDLYLHMSDVDYLGRFSEPGYGKVLFNILFNDFKSKAAYDPVQKEYILKLPRHLKLTVDKYIFTLTSAIIIRLTENNVIDIKFENQTFNNIFPIETNYINFNVFKVNNLETYLNFEIKMPEIDIETAEIPIEKSKLFKSDMTFNPKRKFYYFRAFYYTGTAWNEMIVTHTDQVYDINTPTCIVKVLENTNTVQYYIPPVYINTGIVANKVKFLIYTTNGAINVNFTDFKISDFVSQYNPVFMEDELDAFTQPLQLISKVIYIREEVIDGKDGLLFSELKANVIDNSIGDRKLPITNKQIGFLSSQNNFRLIKDVDVVTNRLFLLETELPNAKTRYPVTKFNLDVIEFRSSISELRLNTNGVIAINNDVTIISEGTVFELTDMGIRILDNTECTQLKALTNIDLTTEVNGRRYLSLFYHYILDTSNNKTELRAYDLSAPNIPRVNFKAFNSTARIGINTTNTNLVKNSTGYSLDVLTNMKKYVNTINETNITPYLVYQDSSGSLFYLEGRLFSSLNDNPVYRFDINSKYHIDADGKIAITNFTDNNGSPTTVTVSLTSDIELIYVCDTVPPNYVSSDIDNYIYNSYLAIGKTVVTLEELHFVFGLTLERLYRQIHTTTGVYQYEVYTEDVPLLYTSNVYDASNQITHHIGEPVLTEAGLPVYQYLKGDIKLDASGSPIPVNTLELTRFINLLFIDYRASISTKGIVVDYRNYIRSYLTEKIVDNANVVQAELLENTEAYVVVPKNISNIRVKTPTREVVISSMQHIGVNVYVNERIYKDLVTRDSITYTILESVDDYLYNNTLLSKTELLEILYSKLKEFVSSVSLDQFTELNEEYIEVLDTNARISLNKLLTTEVDGYNLVEDVLINFILV